MPATGGRCAGPSGDDVLFVHRHRAGHTGTGRVGPVASGHRRVGRFTVRSREIDPRAEAIGAGAATLGLPLEGAVTVADVVFVEGDLDDDGSASGSATSSPIRCCRPARGTCPDGAPGIEITLHPGVTDGAADAVVHAGAQLGVTVTAAATGRRIELPPGTVRRRRRRPAAAARRQPDHRAAGRTGIADARRCTPAPTTVPGVEIDRRPRPRRRRAGRARRRARRWPSTPRSCVAIQAHFEAAGPRPDRRRAGDAGPDVERALRPQDVPGRDHRRRRDRRCRRCSPSCATRPTRSPRRSCGRRSSATPASCRSATARRSPSRPRPTTTRPRSSRSAAPTPASAASSAT